MTQPAPAAEAAVQALSWQMLTGPAHLAAQLFAEHLKALLRTLQRHCGGHGQLQHPLGTPHWL